jgi:hypothetical protein
MSFFKKKPKRLQFAPSEPAVPTKEPSYDEAVMAEVMKQYFKKIEEKPSSSKKKDQKKEEATVPDVVQEQREPVYTTLYCPEAVKDVKEVLRHPQEYIEVNVIRRTRIVDTFAVRIGITKFHYKDKERKHPYTIDEKYVYLLPTKAGYLMPTAFYKEGRRDPVRFLNTNKGITAKALALLYMEQLYTSLLAPDEDRYNLFIVIFSVALLCCFAAGCYLVFVHNGGMF